MGSYKSNVGTWESLLKFGGKTEIPHFNAIKGGLKIYVILSNLALRKVLYMNEREQFLRNTKR